MTLSWRNFVQLAVLFSASWLLAADARPALPMTVVYEAILRNGFSTRYHHGEMLQNVTRLYLTSDGRGYVDVPTGDIVTITCEEIPAAPAASPPDIGKIVREAGARHQLDPDLINSIIRAESGFNSKAVSPKGGQGLMQLMPQTAAQLGVSDPFDPASNVDAGTRYFRELLQYYGGDIVKALAAYNAGPQRVAQYGGVPPYRETHTYLAGVIRDYNRRKLAEAPRVRQISARPRTQR